tara:strand:- start:57399 stop:57560 length:162 start_codon:yes stop_codon:yes gene_type:complete
MSTIEFILKRKLSIDTIRVGVNLIDKRYALRNCMRDKLPVSDIQRYASITGCL